MVCFKNNTKVYLFVLLYFCLILSYIFSVFSFLDELVAIVALFYFIVMLINRKQSKMCVLFVSMLIFLIILGLIGNVIYKTYAPDLKNIFMDIFLFIKPYLFFSFGIFFISSVEMRKISYYMSILSQILLILFFVLALVYFFKNITDYSNWRFSILSCFPGDIATITMLSLVWIFTYEYSKMKKLFFLIATFIIFLTDSGLGLLGVVLFFILYFFLTRFKFKKYMIILFTLLVLSVSMNEISSYLTNDNAPRYKMFYYSFKTAFSFFPLGSGFGTYGGVVSATNYSKLYFLYGFNNVWGLSIDSLYTSPNFLFDTYYPMIIAQFGFLGFFVFIFVVLYGLKKCILCKNKNAIFLILFLLAMGLGFNVGGLVGCVYFLSLGALALNN